MPNLIIISAPLWEIIADNKIRISFSFDKIRFYTTMRANIEHLVDFWPPICYQFSFPTILNSTILWPFFEFGAWCDYNILACEVSRTAFLLAPITFGDNFKVLQIVVKINFSKLMCSWTALLIQNNFIFKISEANLHIGAIYVSRMTFLAPSELYKCRCLSVCLMDGWSVTISFFSAYEAYEAKRAYRA